MATRKFALVSALTLFAASLFAFATAARADDDPPGRVARLNFIQGSISFQPGGETDWVQANPNRPLTTGDNLWADKDSRGELHIGSTSIRISSETGMTFLNLDDRTVQLQLAQGSMDVRVRRMEGGDVFEIDTPSLAFTLLRPGEYRVDVDPSGGSTSVTVRDGEGDATGGGSEYHMDSGDQATFSGTDSLTYDGGQAGPPDAFDQWCRSRDDREDRSPSAHYVSRDVPGYDDLDDNGDWRDVPDYGYVWFPSRVAVGWAPYRFGHWVFVAPWGWTWVEDEPWGFAPFHYGRWAVYGGAWCWVPGPVVVRPVYAPALVVFVGGAHFGASLSFGGGGGVAWFPLGPREVYVPPYHVSERYVQRVNITNTTVNVVNVTNVYNNVVINKNTTVNNITYMHQNNVAAVTVVSHDTFVNARPVAAAAAHVNAEQLRTAEVQHNFTVAPIQKSVVGAAAPAAVRPPQAVMQRQVVAKQVPPAPRQSFNATTNATAQNPVRLAGQPARGATQAQPPAAQPAKPGFRTFEAPSQQQPQQQSRQQQSSIQEQQNQSRPPVNANDAGRVQTPPQPGRASAAQAPARPAFTPPPPAQNPNVKMAPPAHATENTYTPHQFEHPQNVERPQAAAPPQAQRPPERAPEPQPERNQPREQESKKPENEKGKK